MKNSTRQKYALLFIKSVIVCVVAMPCFVWSMQERSNCFFSLNDQLESAVLAESVDTVGTLLKRGADVNTVFMYTKSPLLYATEKGNLPLVRTILGHKPDLERSNSFQKTALILAAIRGEEPILKALLDAGAQVNAADEDGMTALYAAAEGGFEPCVMTLLQAHAQVDMPLAWEKRTPLCAAAAGGHLTILNALIAAGASPDIKDCKGHTPLDLARFSGHDKVVSRLQEIKK